MPSWSPPNENSPWLCILQTLQSTGKHHWHYLQEYLPLSPSVLFNPLHLDFHTHHSTEITIINSQRPRHHQTRCHLSCHLTSLLSKIQKWIFSLEVCSLPSSMEDPLSLWAILSSIFSEPVFSSILETLAFLRAPSWDLLCSFLSLSLILFFSQFHFTQLLQIYASNLNLHF